jgi:hypothetical protein
MSERTDFQRLMNLREHVWRRRQMIELGAIGMRTLYRAPHRYISIEKAMQGYAEYLRWMNW